MRKEKVNSWELIGAIEREENASLKEKNSFRIDTISRLIWKPHNERELAQLIHFYSSPSSNASSEELSAGEGSPKKHPFFVLGHGTNLLLKSQRIEVPLIELSAFDFLEEVFLENFTQTGVQKDQQALGPRADLKEDVKKTKFLRVGAGTSVKNACEKALELSWSGLEFIYGMPGSMGGAAWMNARCYGSEIGDRIEYVEILNEKAQKERVYGNEGYSYKKSPFQNRDVIIMEVVLRLQIGEKKAIEEKMKAHQEDRRLKGHYLYPCAGSVFKNDERFGAPSGKLIDALGLKGLRLGDAQIAPFHGNIAINLGNARGEEIFHLLRIVKNEVLRYYGYELELEIIPLGWEQDELF